MGTICSSCRPIKRKPDTKVEENYRKNSPEPEKNNEIVDDSDVNEEFRKNDPIYQNSEFYAGTLHPEKHYFFEEFDYRQVTNNHNSNTNSKYLNKVNKNLWSNILNFAGEGQAYYLNCRLRNKKFIEICKISKM